MTSSCFLPWVLFFPELKSNELCLLYLNEVLPISEVPLKVYFLSFFLTFFFEATFALLFSGREKRRVLRLVLLANLATHPFAVFVWIPFASQFLNLTARQTMLSAELTIPFIEGYIYLYFRAWSWKTCFALSYGANFLSWALVALLQVWGLFSFFL